jgi:hypothetical protein
MFTQSRQILFTLVFKWSFRFPSCLELADSMLYQFSVSFKFGPYKITDTVVRKHKIAEKLGKYCEWSPVDI